MSEPPTPETIAAWQRRLASQANNRAWTLAESPSRSPREDDELLEAANAAMHLWNIVGNDRQRALAAELLAHAYALRGFGDLARHYFAQGEAVVFGDGAAPWERATGHAIAANVAHASAMRRRIGRILRRRGKLLGRSNRAAIAMSSRRRCG
jgi:hypothetical protein